MKDKFLSKAVPRGTRTIWRYLSALFLLFSLSIGQMWANDYTLAASTFNSDKNAATVDGQTFTLNQAHGGTGQTGYSNYIKFSKNKTYVMTLPTGFTLTNINIKGYTNSNGKTDGAIAEIGGNSQSSKTFPAKDDSNLGSKTQITAGYDFAISQTGGTVAIKTANTNQICVLITITGTPAASGPVDPTASFVGGAYTLGGADLDLSGLYTTNSDGDVTFTITDAGTTSAALRADGKSFYASAAGSATVKVEQAATASFNAFEATATITVSAPAATHSVTAATADASKGTAAAAATTVAEGATTTITATPLVGYVFDHWVVSGAGATLSSTSTNPTTLTMGTENATVTAYFAEKTCPTSGVVYSLAIKSGASTRSLNANTAYDLTSSDVDIIGGTTATIKNSDPSNNGKMSIASGPKFSFGGNNAYLKIVLDCPLQAGDKVDIIGGSGKQLSITPTEPSPAPKDASPKVTTASYTYTVVADDALYGKSTFYMGRAEASSTTMTGITITRPYEITFANGGHGTVPSATTGFEIALTQITGVEDYDHTGWTADKAVKVGGETKAASTALAVDATVELTDNTTFTATWVAKAPTFAVTYKANNGTSEADINDPAASTFAANTFTVPDGKMFAGWNTQADGEGTNYAVGDAVEAATTVYAKWVVDPTIRLIKNNGTLNTVNFVTGGTLQDDTYTVEEVEYTKNVQLGGQCSGVGSIDDYKKVVMYTTTTDATNVKIALYDPYSSNTTHHAFIVVLKEGEETPVVNEDVTIVTGTKRDYLKEYNLTGRSTIYVMVGNTAIRVCQMSVVESGSANAVAPAVGYSANLNKGRLVIPATATATAFEGLTYSVNEKYQPSRTALKIKNKNTEYISFEIPADQTRQLQLSASGSYNVSKTLGDESAYVSGNQNINLAEGTWYINPNGSAVSITNIAFAATPDPLTVTFKDGESTLSEQALFVGDKVAEPEAPTKTGYRFDKWQKSGVDYDFDYTLVASDASGFTLDAVWQKTWKVTFDADNGSDPVVVTVDNNQAVAQPVNPKKAGFDFVEWQLSGSAYNFATLVSDDIILKAVWEVAQTDATISALSYNENAIDVESAENVAGVATYTVVLPWGSTIDKDLISVTKSANTAAVGTIAYDSEAKKATFTVTAGDGITTADYAIQFVIDAKRGTSLIKATTNNVVTGLIGGTRDTNLGDGNTKKLNSNTYFGVTLANDETFQEGDVFIINITTAADLGKFMVYADKDRTVLVADQGIVYTKSNVTEPVVCPTGEMRLVLPATANGKKSLYLSRENSSTAQWNPTFSYVEVTREMAPAIKSFKIGEAEGTINESAKTINIEVPYATDVKALTPTVEAYGNNGATYTPDGETDFRTSVNYVVTDAYGELSTTYAVTVNVAAPSENAYLASLSVAGYTLDFNKETTTYNVVLDYGTTDLPEITYAVEDAGLATAVKVEDDVNGTTTITVTPQAGAGYEKVYKINFSVSTTPKFVIYDGSTMTDIASATGSDATTGFSYSLASNVALTGSDVASSWNGKNYAHVIKGFKPNDNTNNIVSFVIPEGYVAKVRLVGTSNSDGTERSMFIAKTASRSTSDAIAGTIITSNSYAAQGIVSALLLPNTYYLGSTDACRLYELSVQLYPIDYTRDVTEGRYGTICLPNGGVMVGASIYEVAYFGDTSKKIFFDEVLNGVMVAGVPYVFLPKEGVSKLAVTYTDAANEGAKEVNGLVGFIGASENAETQVPDDEKCYILQNNQYRQVLAGANARIKSNRAYIILDDIGRTEPALAPGRRRISMGVQSEQVATGIGDVQGDEVQSSKVLINGQLFILRGEKMYDATGRLVK